MPSSVVYSVVLAAGPVAEGGKAGSIVDHPLAFVSVLLVLAALFAYFNYRVLKLPTTIGLMALTMLASLVAVLVGLVYPPFSAGAAKFVEAIDFNETVLHGMLAFLLFAGALHVDLDDLYRQCRAITALVLIGVGLSTVVVAGLTWVALWAIGLTMGFGYCLLFGALISPTDPIAVIGLLKRLGAPKDLEVTIAGESLFNDGVGVVLFVGLLAIMSPEKHPEMMGAGLGQQVLFFGKLFLMEAVGGVVLGLIVGYVTYLMLRDVDNYHVEILLSLALASGGFSLAESLHVSGAITVVVAGLMIGNHGKTFAMSPVTVEHLDLFWELVDEILNAVLFVLLGLEILALTFTGSFLFAGLLAVPVVLIARSIAVGVPVALTPKGELPANTTPMLIWGGLRGAISVALALSLPQTMGAGDGQEVVAGTVPTGRERELILVMTYVVVVFSVLVQGLTIGPLAQRWLGTGAGVEGAK